MSYTYAIVDTRTGVKQETVFPASGSWKRILNGNGSGSHTFQLGDRALSSASWRALTTPWARTLVVSRNGSVVYAGLITSRPYDHGTTTLTVNHTDIRGILASRYPFGVGTYAGGTLVCSGLSLRAIAGRVVAAGLTGPRSTYSLPIIIPTTTELGNDSRTYDNWNFQTVSDILDDLQQVANGPDIDFEPRWSASGTLEYVMRVGTPTVPLLGGASFDFNMNGTKSPLSGIGVNEDGSAQISGVFIIGQGSEADMIVGGIPVGSELPGIIPARDTTQSFKTVTTEATAGAMAVAASAALYGLTKQWDFKMVANDAVPIEGLRLGCTLKLHFQNDPWIPDGWSSLRLIGLSGDMTETVTPIVQGSA